MILYDMILAEGHTNTPHTQQHNNQQDIHIILEYCSELRQTSLKHLISRYPCSTLRLYYGLHNTTITNRNVLCIWHITKDQLVNLTHTQLVLLYIISFLPKLIYSIDLGQFTFDNSFTPHTPILFSPKFKYLYVSQGEIWVSTGTLINRKLPKN